MAHNIDSNESESSANVKPRISNRLKRSRYESMPKEDLVALLSMRDAMNSDRQARFQIRRAARIVHRRRKRRKSPSKP